MTGSRYCYLKFPKCRQVAILDMVQPKQLHLICRPRTHYPRIKHCCEQAYYTLHAAQQVAVCKLHDVMYQLSMRTTSTNNTEHCSILTLTAGQEAFDRQTEGQIYKTDTSTDNKCRYKAHK